MIKILTTFFVFCLVLFLYLHVYYHLKTSDDLEVYEIDDCSKDKLEEICELRQPIIFDFDCGAIVQNTNKSTILNNYHAFDIKVRNTADKKGDDELYMPLLLSTATKLFSEDKTSSYYSENNKEFLEETGLIKHMQYNDEFLRPPMVSNCEYDILFGSENTKTKFRFNLDYRNYYTATEGSVRVKLSPPKSSRYLKTIYDYENFEFSSLVNPWAPQPQFKADFDKMKCLDIVLKQGQTLFVPPYWWYSIEFQKNSSITSFRYRTYMNNIAVVPHICMYLLQNQNVKRVVVKKATCKVDSDKEANNGTTSIDDIGTVVDEVVGDEVVGGDEVAYEVEDNTPTSNIGSTSL